MAESPDRIALAPGLDISRIVTGLWQVADMERDGKLLDQEAAPRRCSNTPERASTLSTWPTTTAARN